MLLVFGAALYYRTQLQSFDQSVVTTIEAAGMILLGYAGWMGGTLVYRNQIGVNPRYANAGRYREVHLHAANGQFEFDDTQDMDVNQMCLVHVDGKRVVVAKTETGWTAFSDHCTHRGGSLAGGSMICSTVQCPWHGSQFDVNNGNVKAGPAREKINVYKVEDKNGKLLIRL
jgi:nitrite reductase/ring-hydroxylating ferredoxin subunit